MSIAVMHCFYYFFFFVVVVVVVVVVFMFSLFSTFYILGISKFMVARIALLAL